MILLTFMYALWSSVFTLGKWTLEHTPPLFLTASRMLLAGVLLLGFLALTRRSALKITIRQGCSLALLAVFSVYLANAFEFWGLKQMSAAKTCFFYSLVPFFSAFFSYLHFGETMNGRKWLGMAIGFAGFIPVLAVQKGADELLSSLAFLSWPELSMLGASICGAYGWILLRLLVKDQISPPTANGYSMLLGGLFALIHSLFVDPWAPTPIKPGEFSLFAQGVLLMTLISNIVCYNLMGLLLKRFTATFISFMGLLSPIFTSLHSWIFLKEPLSPVIFGSTAVVSIGLWLIYSAELRQGYILTKSNSKDAQLS